MKASRLRIEPTPRIRNPHPHAVTFSHDVDIHFLGTTVLQDIVKRLLRYPKQAQANIIGKVSQSVPSGESHGDTALKRAVLL